MGSGPLSEFDWDMARLSPDSYDQAKKVECYQIPPVNLPLLATPEETQEISTITPDLFTYQSEMQTKFVLGQESLTSGWDDYTKTMDDLGVQRFRDLLQARYDRFANGSRGRRVGRLKTQPARPPRAPDASSRPRPCLEPANPCRMVAGDRLGDLRAG